MINDFMYQEQREILFFTENAKGGEDMFSMIALAMTASMEYFIAGSTAAISLYCGTKLPRNKRK